jgi:hypothetical protein
MPVLVTGGRRRRRKVRRTVVRGGTCTEGERRWTRRLVRVEEGKRESVGG